MWKVLNHFFPINLKLSFSTLSATNISFYEVLRNIHGGATADNMLFVLEGLQIMRFIVVGLKCTLVVWCKCINSVHCRTLTTVGRLRTCLQLHQIDVYGAITYLKNGLMLPPGESWRIKSIFFYCFFFSSGSSSQTSWPLPYFATSFSMILLSDWLTPITCIKQGRLSRRARQPNLRANWRMTESPEVLARPLCGC